MTASDLAWVRSEVGAVPDDSTLNANYDRLGGRAKVALEIWRTRHADFVRVAAQLGADGLSKGTSANITAAEKIIAKLEVLAHGEDPVDPEDAVGGTTFLSRPDRMVRRGCSEEQILSRYR